MNRKRLSAIVLLIIFIGTVLTGCGRRPLMQNQPMVSIASTTGHMSIDSNEFESRSAINSKLLISGTQLKEVVSVTSITMNFYGGKRKIYYKTFSLENVKLSPNGSVQVDLSQLDLSSLHEELTGDEISAITRVEFILNFDQIPSVDATFNLSFAKLPVIFVSAGQSGGVYVTSGICDMAGIPYDWAACPYGSDLASGVNIPAYIPGEGVPPLKFVYNSGEETGTPYRTLVLVMGASPMGMTASGLTTETEIKRIQSNIDWAKENGVPIIGMQIEGKSLRGKPGSDAERIIDAVLPACDMVIVTSGSDYDGKFSQWGRNNNIPVEIVKSTLDLIPVFKQIFDVR